MGKTFKRVFACLLVVVMCVCAMPMTGIELTASAICCRKDSFDKSRYTLTGDMAYDVAMIAKSQKGRTCLDFGYSGVDYGAWCDEFVADCIENAGGDDSIVAHGGTVSDFKNKMTARGAYTTTSPKTGDLVFFGDWHVEIVTKVENGIVYCAGGNNGSSPGSCAGERRASYIGSVSAYLRPNYRNNPQPSDSFDFNKPATYPSYPGILKSGSRGQAVSFVQTSLNWLGYNCGSVDGQYGSNTASAVWSFQEDNGLEVDGIVGEQTWSTLVGRVGINDIGTGFYAHIIQHEDWKHVESSADNDRINKDGSKCESNVQIAKNGIDVYDPRQVWYIERQDDGTYKMVNMYNDKVLDVDNGDTTNGTNIATYNSHNGANQRWVIFYNNKGNSYGFRSCCGDGVMDVNGGNIDPGTNIQIWEYNDTKAQHFIFYNLSNDGRTYSKPSKPDASTISIVSLGKANETTTLKWTESPLKNNYDYRNYDLKIGHGTGDSVEWDESLTKRDLTSTTYGIKLPAGTYTAQVVSVNERFSGWWTYGNKITFTVENAPIHTHSYTGKVTKEATCENSGIKTYTCSGCSDSYTETIPAKGHKAVTDPAVAPTCTSEGKTEGSHCSVCNTVIKAQTTIKKLSHTDTNNDGKCDSCGKQLSETPTEPTQPTPETCNHICHKRGFSGFIYKLILPFWKMFKINKTCTCGIEHY